MGGSASKGDSCPGVPYRLDFLLSKRNEWSVKRPSGKMRGDAGAARKEHRKRESNRGDGWIFVCLTAFLHIPPFIYQFGCVRAIAVQVVSSFLHLWNLGTFRFGCYKQLSKKISAWMSYRFMQLNRNQNFLSLPKSDLWNVTWELILKLRFARIYFWFLVETSEVYYKVMLFSVKKHL